MLSRLKSILRQPITASIAALARDLSPLRRVLILTACLVTVFGVGVSAYEDVNAGFATATMDVIRDAYLWNLLQDLFPIQPLMLFRQTFVLLISALAALGLGILLFVLWRRVGSTALSVMLILGLVLTPTIALGKGNDFFACGGSDVFASYEKAGGQLRDWEKAILELGGYEKIISTTKVEKCRWQSIIDVYQRVKP